MHVFLLSDINIVKNSVVVGIGLADENEAEHWERFLLPQLHP